MRRATQWVFVERLMLLAESWATPEVRGVAEWHLRRFQEDLEAQDGAHAHALSEAIRRFRERRMMFYAPVNKVADELPPGSPIGTTQAVTPEVWPAFLGRRRSRSERAPSQLRGRSLSWRAVAIAERVGSHRGSYGTLGFTGRSDGRRREGPQDVNLEPCEPRRWKIHLGL